MNESYFFYQKKSISSMRDSCDDCGDGRGFGALKRT